MARRAMLVLVTMAVVFRRRLALPSTGSPRIVVDTGPPALPVSPPPVP